MQGFLYLNGASIHFCRGLRSGPRRHTGYGVLHPRDWTPLNPTWGSREFHIGRQQILSTMPIVLLLVQDMKVHSRFGKPGEKTRSCGNVSHAFSMSAARAATLQISTPLYMISHKASKLLKSYITGAAELVYIFAVHVWATQHISNH